MVEKYNVWIGILLQQANQTWSILNKTHGKRPWSTEPARKEPEKRLHNYGAASEELEPHNPSTLDSATSDESR